MKTVNFIIFTFIGFYFGGTVAVNLYRRNPSIVNDFVNGYYKRTLNSNNTAKSSGSFTALLLRLFN